MAKDIRFTDDANQFLELIVGVKQFLEVIAVAKQFLALVVCAKQFLELIVGSQTLTKKCSLAKESSSFIADNINIMKVLTSLSDY